MNQNTKTAQNIAGAGGNREENDFYATPASATQALLDRESFFGKTWEPACGAGDMSDVLIKNGMETYSSDLIARGYGDGGVDFLTCANVAADNIITNPPFKHATAFIEHAKEVATKKVAMLLKTVFLESEGRYEMFQDTDFALKTVYQFSKRITLRRSGVKQDSSGMLAYAWFVWERGFEGKPTIEWIQRA